MNKLILRNTNLNRNLSLVIYKYIDYSLEYFKKLKTKSIISSYVYIDDIDIMDIVIKSISLGFNGFYISETYKNICEDLEIKAKRSNILTYVRKNNKLGIYISNLSGGSIDIISLGILKTEFEY
jgi:hypothetical protein